MTRPPLAVIFDVGGTLITMDAGAVGDLVEPFCGSRPAAEALRRAHYVAMHELAAAGGTGAAAFDGEGWWRWWLGRNLELSGLTPDPRAIEALVGASGLWRAALPGALAGVVAVRDAGYRVGVVSNADGRVAEDLAAAGFGGLFDVIVDSTLVGVAKPDPAIFDFALDALAVRPEEAWYVGDSIVFDVAGARAARLGEVVIADPYGLSGHRPAVRRLTELPDLLAAGRRTTG